MRPFLFPFPNMGKKNSIFMDWKFSKFKPGQPRRWEFLLPPGSAKKTESVLESIVSNPFLPRTHEPTWTVYPEKFVLEKANFRQALEILARIPWIRDFRLNLGKYRFDKHFSFAGLIESLHTTGLLPKEWEIRFHPQVRGRTEVSREDLQELWEESYESGTYSEGQKFTECNALCIGEDIVISLSLGGDPLFKRGNFKALGKSAPVREDSASFLLYLLREKMENPEAIFVPFAGSGTFVWEAISMIAGIGFPHLERKYMFREWNDFPEPTWEFLKKRIGEKGENRSLRVWWNEIEGDIFSYLEERSGEYQKFIKYASPNFKLSVTGEEGDFFSFSPKEIWDSMGKPERIWMPLNPPYGMRVQKGSHAGLYRRLTEAVKEFWALSAEVSGFVLCPDEESWSAFLKGLGTKSETVHITHGGIDLRAVYF